MSVSKDSHPRVPLPLHPMFLTALTLLILNDHLFKEAFGNWWTGKLSDAAWLVLCPLFMIAAYELVTDRQATVGMYVVSSALVIAALTSVNIVPWTGDIYQTGLSAAQWPFRVLAALVIGGDIPQVGQVQLTRDPSDLVTLPFALLPVTVATVRKHSPVPPGAGVLSTAGHG